MAKEYIKLWKSYAAYFEPLGAAEVGRLVLAMLEYESTGTAPKLDGNERFVWPAIQRDLDEAMDAYENKAATNRSNGGKGGRPKNQNGFSENPKNPNGFEKTQNDKDKDKDKDILSSSSACAHEENDFIIGANIDPDMDKIICCYESTIGSTVPGTIAGEMREYLKKMDADCVIRAIEESATQNVRKWSYIKAILSRKIADGVTNIRLWEASEARRKEMDRPKRAGNKESDSEKIDRIFANMEATG